MGKQESLDRVSDTRELIDLIASLSPADKAQVKGIIIGMQLKGVSHEEESLGEERPTNR